MFPYAAYATSITSILLYLLLYISRHHLCFAAARIRRTAARLHIVRCGEFCFISLPLFFFFFYFILMTVLLHAARAHAREDYNAGCR